MIFLDYDVRTYNIRSGNAQSYTIPYKCLIHVGFVRPDDDVFPSIRLRSYGGIPSEGANGVDYYLMHPDTRSLGGGYVPAGVGSVIAKTGDVLVLDGDEVDIEVHIFRLPEAE